MDLGSYVRDECIGTSECPSKFCPLRFVVKSGESCGAADKKPSYNIGDGRTTTFRGEIYLLIKIDFYDLCKEQGR